MAELSPEAKTIYDMLKAETAEEYENKFLAHKKEILDAVKKFVNDTEKQIREVGAGLEAAQLKASEDPVDVRANLGNAVKTAMSSKTSQLAATMDRAIRLGPSASAGGSAASPNLTPGGWSCRHRWAPRYATTSAEGECLALVLSGQSGIVSVRRVQPQARGEEMRGVFRALDYPGGALDFSCVIDIPRSSGNVAGIILGQIPARQLS